jgi:integrase/recombinase XerD
MLDSVQKLLADGVSATSVNTYLRGLKAYVRWLHAEGHVKEIFQVQFLKTEQKILATLIPEQIRAFFNCKPKGINQTRTHAAALLMLDCGLRISEVLGLHYEHCDFDNLVLKVRGKGNRKSAFIEAGCGIYDNLLNDSAE